MDLQRFIGASLRFSGPACADLTPTLLAGLDAAKLTL